MNMNYPIVRINVKSKRPDLIPILSKKIPPNIGRTIFGNE